MNNIAYKKKTFRVTPTEKKVIEKTAKKIAKEYGKTLKLLAKE